MTPDVPHDNCHDLTPAGADGAPKRKAPFVAPRLTCYGAVVDLTQQFGGSLTPEDREAQEREAQGLG
jgi:hypothetical protein